MTTFSRSVTLPVTATQAFDWHERSGAFGRLTPPWENVTLLEHEGGIRDGAKVVVRVKPFGPVGFTAVYRHVEYQHGVQFVDLQEKGPFRTWRHEHRFHAQGDTCVLEDHIEFNAPPLSTALVLKRLDRMFTYRHAMTFADLKHEARFGPVDPKTVLVTGATGLVGQALCARLTTRGHRVKKVSRRPGPDTVVWNVAEGVLPGAALEGIDSVVHLAGEPIAQRWTPAVKKRIMDSRVQSARLLVDAILACEQKPVYISASGINAYHGGGEGPFEESAPMGNSFLAEVCKAWEGAADPLREAGVPVTTMRTGVVLSGKGAALAKMLPAFKFGIAGKLGSGSQHMPWVSLDDLVDQYLLAIEQPDYVGVFNNIAPQLTTNAVFTQALGKVLNRPTVMPAPAGLLKLIFGEMAEEALLGDVPAVPAALEDRTYAWRLPDLAGCLRHELGR